MTIEQELVQLERLIQTLASAVSDQFKEGRNPEALLAHVDMALARIRVLRGGGGAKVHS